MEQANKEWLPHLEDAVPQKAKGYTLSMYSIALEAWRRGITVKFYNTTEKKSRLRYSLSYEGKEYTFVGSRGSIVPREAIKICIDKHLTKKYLLRAGIPVPEGEEYSGEVPDEEIVEYSKRLGYPLVIKPSKGTGGKGVIANIRSEEEFRSALSYVRNDLNYPEVIVERYAVGIDHRVFVIGNEVIGAFKRIPANVVGDGVNTIRTLLRVKNKERDKNPSLNGLPITIDKEVHSTLEKVGYTLDSIPKEGERVFLKTKNNVSSGGDSTDATDDLSDEIKKIAIDACKAIPGLIQCGIDMIIDYETNTVSILEINSRASVRNHLFPMEGKARDIPKAIIDYYFPETKGKRKNLLYYFDFDTIHDAFRRGVANEFLVPSLPTGNIDSRRFLLSKKQSSTSFDKWVQKQARELKLNGYIKHLKNNKTSIIVSGCVESVDHFREIVNNRLPKKYKVTRVDEKNWDKPIKIGFEIKEPSISYKESELQVLSKELKELQKERNLYKKKYQEIQKSTSWKVTKPLRAMASLIKMR
ncbi:ATP-grasp domain-containing protein [Halalkalibacterium halodurans]|uniref:ATP-binding protein n=2 Tax=Halalkalibacterium halodurans TaxID=86665 RepID=UPI002E1CA068|nr:ATP-grasp domain-containing protein [Halalkalibacterium halodurans]MED4083655.1 ATP-grasp domain-containing protein [Halalkalibacterium halodurans]MED4106592.1 ATP-grasp domain-containing protein [Halalkalibacterium halodurans]MED4107854.1 ATP-grasp domain-containing protein [Halalkalibacterium halodurans]MED4123030.1 ATP-grasp domain-containing protein [Halalkalibacterium halodurans]